MMRRKEGKNNFRQVRTISWYQKKPSIDQMSSVWAVWDFWQPYNVKSLSSSKTSRQQLQAASLTSHEPVSSVSSKNIKASYPVLLEHLRERGRDEEKQASHSSGKNPKYLIIKAKRATETEADSLWVSGLLLTNCELTDWGLCQHSEKRWWMMMNHFYIFFPSLHKSEKYMFLGMDCYIKSGYEWYMNFPSSKKNSRK